MTMGWQRANPNRTQIGSGGGLDAVGGQLACGALERAALGTVAQADAIANLLRIRVRVRRGWLLRWPE